MLAHLPPVWEGKALSIVLITFVGLVIAGIISARIAGSSVLRTTSRIVFGGALGMAITAGVGQIANISGI